MYKSILHKELIVHPDLSLQMCVSFCIRNSDMSMKIYQDWPLRVYKFILWHSEMLNALFRRLFRHPNRALFNQFNPQLDTKIFMNFFSLDIPQTFSLCEKKICEKCTLKIYFSRKRCKDLHSIFILKRLVRKNNSLKNSSRKT